MAMAAVSLSPAEYLNFERRQEGKHEYENETLIPMGGGTKAHNRIAGNLFGFIWSLLRASGLEAQVYQADLRVYAPQGGKYYYPGIVVTQGQEAYLDHAADTLLNPCLIIEVLSDSTEVRDRGVKFDAYRSIPSLKEYVLVAQNDCLVEGFYKNDEGEWLTRAAIHGKENRFAFKTIPLELKLQDIYERAEV